MISSLRRSLWLGLGAALIAAACSSAQDESTPINPTASSTTVDTASSTTTSAPTIEVGPVAAPVRHPASTRPIYFVMPDRFENGDLSNDAAGMEGGPLDHGFDPLDTGFHHGGDLVGLRSRLPYLEELGVGAIWITPPFTNRFVQGDGTQERSSSSYHGYWQVDWTNIDPHLGTEAEMIAFIQDAHARDIHVYFDIVVNHTGDVISFEEGSYAYLGTNAQPFLDAEGVAFDPAQVAGSSDFPQLDPASSFPYTPTFAVAGDSIVKAPEWLNDVTLYHNRGNSTFQGESSLYGDFFGLDDLFTEHPRVVDGMIELYGDIIERYDIDGFRIDTMKHVNLEFWQAFAPAIRERAAALGKPDFFMFGEVVGSDPILQSSYTNVGVSSTLDFIGDEAIRRFVTGGSAADLADAYDKDDWFTDADNNASMQVTFLGNHDEGRLGYLLDSAQPNADDGQLLAQVALANDLLFLTRGTPVVYYGDEQGFTGDGGDQLARQDMFPSQTPAYLDDDLIGTAATAADSNFDPSHPIFMHIAGLADLRATHPVFATGAQIVRYAEDSVFAFSRIDRSERVEYLVVVNRGGEVVRSEVPAMTRSADFVDLRDARVVSSDADGMVVIEVPAYGAAVLRATEPLSEPAGLAEIRIVRPTIDAEILTERYRIEAEVAGAEYAEVTFAVSVDGSPPEVVGVDDVAPYRVYWSNAAIDPGSTAEIITTIDDGSGQLRSDSVDIILGDRAR